MSTPTATKNPLRAKALDYLRSGRVVIEAAGETDVGARRPAFVMAIIEPAPTDPRNLSVQVRVTGSSAGWDCDEHPGRNSCSHRLAVQLVTGYGHLEGAPE